ncbi:ubiquinone/menaquinone biosynthesis C-methylase UbiE [Rhizobium mesoamericanum]|uniref:class I SAM-dependent methyltransferase n=1 Tax=Rhizobium mesoamericanum TaxID=1079800 RepID=UPI002786D1ED|nr:class I SAM-dependent methyltransferase [Rhizobium mesoamericanum]MDQ0561422.1 ubiquinone/menaquinone biosynthesis C-methylase UbiE [Rhizobium mesoamericanum]
MPDRDWWSALWPDPKGLLRQIGVRQGMSVLDLCCGDGYFTGPLAALVDGNVVALDLDPAMIELAKAEVERSGASVRQWICADATSLAERLDDLVDFVLIANTFHGVPDQIGLARSVRAVLQPNGLFCIINWHPVSREETVVLGKPRGPRTEMRMSPEAVRTVVETAGFAMARIVDLPPYHYAAIFQVA